MKVFAVSFILVALAFVGNSTVAVKKEGKGAKGAKGAKSVSPITCPNFPYFGGPGMYCIDMTNLYNCMTPGQKAPKAVSNCVNGCIRQPPGQNDICSVSPTCGDNEQWTPCFSSTCWEGTCASPVVGPQCSMDCKSGCRCRQGFVRDTKGKCVAPRACPSMHVPECPANYHGYAGPGLYCLKNNLHFCQFPNQKSPQLFRACQWGCYTSGPQQPDSCVQAPYGVIPDLQKAQQRQIEMQMQRQMEMQMQHMYMQQLWNQLVQQSQYQQQSVSQYILPQRQTIQPQSLYLQRQVIPSTLPLLSSRQSIYNQLTCNPPHHLHGGVCV